MEQETFMGLVQIKESTQPCFQFINFTFEFILSLPLSWITNYGNTTAYLLINNAFSRFDIPIELNADQGTNFTAQVMQEVWKLFRLLHTKISGRLR